jgi:hypothetical protein
LVFLLKGQRLVMVDGWIARPVAMACRGLAYIGQGRWPLIAQRGHQGVEALMTSADGQMLH